MEKENPDIALDKLNEGQTEAFDSVFRVHYASLCYFSEKIVGNQSAAEDVVQSVFLGFYELKPTFQNQTALRSYLYRAVHNRSLKYLARQRRNVPASEKLPDDKNDPESKHLLYLETRVVEQIFNAIDGLPAACKRIFQMSYIERLSVKDICDTLNISENTVKTQRQRAKKMLREQLQHLYRHLTYIFF